MAAAKRVPVCSECGAEVPLGSAPCPLCGHEHGEDHTNRPVVYDRDRYQKAIRELREQLRDLRDGGAEAV